MCLGAGFMILAGFGARVGELAFQLTYPEFLDRFYPAVDAFDLFVYPVRSA